MSIKEHKIEKNKIKKIKFIAKNMTLIYNLFMGEKSKAK